MKFFLISLIILFVLFVVTKVSIGGMKPIDKLSASIYGNYPKSIIILVYLLILSFIETIISLVVWIINM